MSGNVWMFSNEIDDEDLEFMSHAYVTYNMACEYYRLGIKPVVRMAHEAGAVYKIGIAGALFIEAKTKMNPSQSITVKKSWIDKAKEQSLAMRKEDYAIAVSFGDPKEYYLIEDNLMEDLYKSREALRAVIDAIGGVDHDPLGLESAEIYRIRELIKEAY